MTGPKSRRAIQVEKEQMQELRRHYKPPPIQLGYYKEMDSVTGAIYNLDALGQRVKKLTKAEKKQQKRQRQKARG